MLRVQVVCISPAEEGLFVPLIYGNLRSYAQQDSFLAENVEWLEPVILPDASLPGDIDVLAISLYEWNSEFSYELCKRCKEENSRCFILAGGPDVAWREENFFSSHPYISAVSPGEGEIAFSLLLTNLLQGGCGQNVPGILLNPASGPSTYSDAPMVDFSTKPSPWLSLKDFWRDYFNRYRDYRLAAAFETSRGCPYGCVYCDWGGAYAGTLRFVEEETALREMDFIQKELHPFFIFWTDGNLGIRERDVRLAEHFSENRRHYGSPLSLYYNCNKSSRENNLKIAEAFRAAGLLTKYVLALQHMDAEVLRNIRRKNPSRADTALLAAEMKERDVPLFVQFILGCPGDCFDKALRAWTDLMEIGVHGEYRAYPFGLFPNAAAARSEYMESWAIDAPYRSNYVSFFTLKKGQISTALSHSRYVLGSKGMSREEYRKTLEVFLMVSACHDHGATRLLAIGMREGRGVPYESFYRELYSYLKGSYFFEPAETFSKKWIEDESAAFVLLSRYTGGTVEAEEELSLHLLNHEAEFLDFLEPFASKLGIPPELMEYQRKMLWLPNDSPEDSSIVDLSPEWVKLFQPTADDASPYRICANRLRFPRPWYKEADSKKRQQLYYAQIVQHNAPGARRLIFKTPETT